MLEITAPRYLHGYSASEQDRLVYQADFLEKYIFENVDYTGFDQLLEIGCGVGAETEVLRRRFPYLHITAVDYEPLQIRAAKCRLTRSIAEGKVRLELADAMHLPYRDGQFDSGFVCWVLEHVPQPAAVLRELFRVVRPGGKVYATEVLNAPIFVSPASPAITRYWDRYNDHQRSLGGFPEIGASLTNLFLDAGFSAINTHLLSYHLDRRLDREAQRDFLRYWRSLFLSAAPSLRAADRITADEIAAMEREFEQLSQNPDAVFFLVAMQVSAQRTETRQNR